MWLLIHLPIAVLADEAASNRRQAASLSHAHFPHMRLVYWHYPFMIAKN
jgi:hypothetical protein